MRSDFRGKPSLDASSDIGVRRIGGEPPPDYEERHRVKDDKPCKHRTLDKTSQLRVCWVRFCDKIQVTPPAKMIAKKMAV